MDLSIRMSSKGRTMRLYGNSIAQNREKCSRNFQWIFPRFVLYLTELYSAYLYLHFSNFYAQEGLDGFSNWYMVQAQEERDHAMDFVRYLQNNDVPVVYETIEKPGVALSDRMDPLKAGLEHEKYVTGLIHAICEAAFDDRDFRPMQFLDGFVKEQNEEEVNASELVKKMELFGSDARSLYLLNSELAGRKYSAPSGKK